MARVCFNSFNQAAEKKPTVLIIWGDDIGQFNTRAYNRGTMGYKTPNIDRLATQGALFTDWYGQQSCTAGRAAFVTGQSPFRTGLTKVGLSGAPEGMKKEDPTIATLLRAQGSIRACRGRRRDGLSTLVDGSACLSLPAQVPTSVSGYRAFRDFPPRRKAGSFNLDRVMEGVSKPQGSGN